MKRETSARPSKGEKVASLKKLGSGVGKGLKRIGTGKVRIKWPLPIKKLFSPADVFTLMNFSCGVLSVMLSIDKEGGFRLAMLLILLGVVFDGLDGPVARRFGPSRKFGVWLDSIADAMTFCIAPAILVYMMFNQKGNGTFGFMQSVLVLLSSLSIAILGILRLARFSITHHRFKDFIGLPTPAMAMLAVGFCAIFHWSTSEELDVDIGLVTTGRLLVIPSILLLFSFAMVSDVMYRKLRGNLMVGTGTVLLIMIASLIVGEGEPRLGLYGSIVFLLFCLLYLLSPAAKGPKNIWGASKRMKVFELEREAGTGEEGQCSEMEVPDEDR